MLIFRPVTELKRGQIFELLKESYQGLIDEDGKNKDTYLTSWRQEDEDAFGVPAIGRCVIVSKIENAVVGFCSYDPRNFPKYGIIGQNCILPKFRHKGYGKQQIEELLAIFIKVGCKKAVVTTGASDFFKPARRMYEGLGFKEVSRDVNKKWGNKVINYEKQLYTTDVLGRIEK